MASWYDSSRMTHAELMLLDAPKPMPKAPFFKRLLIALGLS
jgi:hypothetical protein